MVESENVPVNLSAYLNEYDQQKNLFFQQLTMMDSSARLATQTYPENPLAKCMALAPPLFTMDTFLSPINNYVDERYHQLSSKYPGQDDAIVSKIAQEVRMDDVIATVNKIADLKNNVDYAQCFASVDECVCPPNGLITPMLGICMNDDQRVCVNIPPTPDRVTALLLKPKGIRRMTRSKPKKGL